MESKKIKDNQITASSAFNNDFAKNGPQRARLNLESWPPGYRANPRDARGCWIKVGLTNKKIITGLATQGYGVNYSTEWVTSYIVLYKSKAGEMLPFKTLQGNTKNFTGNRDSSSVKRHDIPFPTMTSEIMILPQTWSSNIGLRLELYGCESGYYFLVWRMFDRRYFTPNHAVTTSDEYIIAKEETLKEIEEHLQVIPGFLSVDFVAFTPHRSWLGETVLTAGAKIFCLKSSEENLEAKLNMDIRHGKAVFRFPLRCNCSYPEVIISLNKTLANAKVLYTTQNITIHATTRRGNCHQSLSFQWEIAKASDHVSEFGMFISRGNAFESKSGILNLSGSEFGEGFLYIRCAAFIRNSGGELVLETYDYGYVRLLDPPLVALINGPTTAIKGNGTVVLDASSSHDPLSIINNNSGLIFSWFCRKMDEKLRSCFGRYSKRFHSTRSILIVDVDYMDANYTYMFELVIMKDRRVTRAFHNLTVTPPYVISLSCVINCGRKVSTNRRLIVEATCIGPFCGQEMSYRWTLYQISSTERGASWLKVRKFRRYVLTNLDSSNILFSGSKNPLKQSTHYKIVASVRLRHRMIERGEMVFITNTPPHNPYGDLGCQAYPRMGIVLKTDFSITCTGWLDEDLPLTYQLIFHSLEGTVIIAKGNISNFKTKLPRGSQSENFEVKLEEQIFDSFGDVATAELTVQAKDEVLRHLAVVQPQLLQEVTQLSAVVIKATRQRENMRVTSLYDAGTLLKSMTSHLNTEASNSKDIDEIEMVGGALLNGMSYVFDILTKNKVTDAKHNQMAERIEQNPRLIEESVALVDNLGTALLSTKVVGESEPSVYETNALSMVLDRQTPAMIVRKHLLGRSSGSGVVFPPQAALKFPNHSVDVQMLIFKYNPFYWDNTAKNITSAVRDLSIKRNGTEIHISDLKEPFELFIPLKTQSVRRTFNTFFVKPSETFENIRYHEISIPSEETVAIIDIVPSGNNLLEVFISAGIRPTPENYSFNSQIPHYGNCGNSVSETILDQQCSPYRLLISSSLTGKTGVYYIAILVGLKTNHTSLHCLCTHLSTFGGEFFVAPNPIDFDKVWLEFKNVEETGNFVLAAVFSIYGLYVVGLLLARRFDSKDQDKVVANVLLSEDNPQEGHHYEIQIQTGIWKGFGTTATVGIDIFGDEGSSGPIILSDSSLYGKLFSRGSVTNFVVFLPCSLGSLEKLLIWHDNFGSSPSWFLQQVIITESHEGKTWYFFANKWIAIERGSGNLCIELKARKEKERAGFRHLFLSKASRGLGDDHLWLSLFTRPPHSSFTRCQRLSCCVSFLFLSMVTNAMFYQFSESPSHTFRVGPMVLSWRQVVIGIQSGLIAIPVNVLLITIFRNVRAHSESYSDLGTTQRSSSRLPDYFVYIAWFLCAFITLSSSAFTVFYGLSWGKDISNQWLTSILTSFFGDIVLTQPMKVILLAMIVSLRTRSLPEKEEVYGMTAYINRKQEYNAPNNHDLNRARADGRKFFRMWRMIKDLLVFLVFVHVLMVVCYSNRDYKRYLVTASVEEKLTGFNEVTDKNSFWIWIRNKLVPGLYNVSWYNKHPFAYEEGFISNKAAFLMGMPRLRQIRFKEEINIHCKFFRVTGAKERVLKNCSPYQSTASEDKNAFYQPGWIPVDNHTLYSENSLLSQLCPKPWRYKSPQTLQTLPYQGYFRTYDGGGYVAYLGYNEISALEIIDNLQNNNWLDESTAAVFIEFSVHEPSSRLFSFARYFYERLPTGGSVTSRDVQTWTLYRASSSFYAVYELLFVILSLLIILSEVKEFALVTVLQLCIGGNVNLTDVKMQYQVLGSLYIFTLVIWMGLLLVNFVIVIIVEYYREVRTNATSPYASLTEFMCNYFSAKLTRLLKWNVKRRGFKLPNDAYRKELWLREFGAVSQDLHTSLQSLDLESRSTLSLQNFDNFHSYANCQGLFKSISIVNENKELLLNDEDGETTRYWNTGEEDIAVSQSLSLSPMTPSSNDTQHDLKRVFKIRLILKLCYFECSYDLSELEVERFKSNIVEIALELKRMLAYLRKVPA
ncbi:Polycystic kidney disease protein 1-like 2 [Stylophora pistillata]|uniref:Polycystic kidney disease protein 1-like 2 n=1 Tax=Stylophora pistillata TaxID=50429 RepID=A0A2B4SAE4_STYPI|nr:Polycystic kidney disease protein 1-like 2 [Stylophora pistillata]